MCYFQICSISRSASPRLYFLLDDELITLLAKSHNNILFIDHFFGKLVQSCRQTIQAEAYPHNSLYPVLNTNDRPKRVINGWKRCLDCLTCKYSRNMKQFKCTATGQIHTIEQAINCEDSNVIYVIECLLCKQQYVGRTSNVFRIRMNAHRSSIGKSQTTVARHFEKPGHKLHHFFCFAIEIVSGDIFTLAARERMYIDKLDVVSRGINATRTNK